MTVRLLADRPIEVGFHGLHEGVEAYQMHKNC